ncbi:MAG: PD-(D/E)XK nuclease family protein [Gemmataceae bacterium]|nr:PD-(D/E)XK nuclease family protein [Gemmataceae bacterium]
MPRFANNVFHRLHKWAARQDENFLTESLALVIEQLLVLAPESGTRLVSKLTGGLIALPAEDASAIEIHTQIETDQGRPDLEIRSPNRLAWIEVKVESPLRTGQLEGYRVALRESGIANNRLLLLTRYPVELKADDAKPDQAIRWFEIADWIDEELHHAIPVDQVAGFLLEQLFDFLEARNMTIAQVGKYMPEGLKALSNLMNMLVEAANACKVSVKKLPQWDDIGVYLDGKKYWIGVNFSEPELLYFNTCDCRIDPIAAGKLGVGKVEQEDWIPGQNRWMRWVELDSEEIHFFARSKISQMEWLENHLRECLSMAKSIEIP